VQDVLFDDRAHAGRLLAARLADLAGEDVVVLALPRGGVPVGMEIASQLGADLDILVVKKLGAPGHEELALGAVGADGRMVVNRDVAAAFRVDETALGARAAAMARQMATWGTHLRRGHPPQPIADRTAVVVDDGIATGATMRAALEIIRSARPALLVAAVPVAPPDACAELAAVADRVECLHQPVLFGSVGRWYRDFTQLTDEDVQQILATARGQTVQG